MRYVVWIHRPNQSFHCHYALCLAGFLAKINHTVDVYICGHNNVYCFEKAIAKLDDGDPCSPCKQPITELETLGNSIKTILGDKKNNLNITDIGEKISHYNNNRSISDELVDNEYQRYKLDYKSSTQGDKSKQLFGLEQYSWLSESCSISGMTPFDIADKEIAIPEVLKQIKYSFL